MDGRMGAGVAFPIDVGAQAHGWTLPMGQHPLFDQGVEGTAQVVPMRTTISVKKSLFAALLLFLSGYQFAHADGCSRPVRTIEVPAQEQLRIRLKKDHPRLLIAAEDIARTKKLITENTLAEKWYAKKLQEGHGILMEPPSAYTTRKSEGLLAVSRTVLKRVYTLALLFHLEGEDRYRQRLWEELSAAASFPTWHPEHFLDTAEMTHAFAIAYDWLYDTWSPRQREILRTAIRDKGLNPAHRAYEGLSQSGWWVSTPYNWNLVCNGGIGMGALAILDEAPELAGAVLLETLHSVPKAMAQFAPDGGYDEGTLYWGYATYYATLFLASLETALGSTFGLAELPGYNRTGLFPIHLTGPQSATFNYADADGETYWTSHMFWLARKFHQPAFAWYARQINQIHALDLLWFSADGNEPATEGLPLDASFPSTQVVTVRSDWTDRDGVFVGFKGGSNRTPHSHLDLGSFVLDALGVRWAVDLGPDDYDLPGYFDAGRWDYYRTRSEGHNTLVINPDAGSDQNVHACAPIIRSAFEPSRSFAIVDLSSAYQPRATRVWRGLALVDRSRVVIQDEIQTSEPAEVWWGMHTPAEVHLAEDKKSALLTLGNSHLTARILTPVTATFTTVKSRPLPSSPHPLRQTPNEGITKLAVKLRDVREVRLVVLLEPVAKSRQGPAVPVQVEALADWH
ncbi:MAG TPA: coagulation factor 5/8 type domain-containing protein [Syntrophobacteraceae bacterium]|nr:coagulation factor 5/8 type domain-containing protein [Syntrophobacteraceae bacterium]